MIWIPFTSCNINSDEDKQLLPDCAWIPFTSFSIYSDKYLLRHVASIQNTFSSCSINSDDDKQLLPDCAVIVNPQRSWSCVVGWHSDCFNLHGQNNDIYSISFVCIVGGHSDCFDLVRNNILYKCKMTWYIMVKLHNIQWVKLAWKLYLPFCVIRDVQVHVYKGNFLSALNIV